MHFQEIQRILGIPRNRRRPPGRGMGAGARVCVAPGAVCVVAFEPCGAAGLPAGVAPALRRRASCRSRAGLRGATRGP